MTAYWAVVPARGGSKSIPRKNLLTLDGRPLLDYCVRAAQASRRFVRIFCSTDDSVIAARAHELGIEVDARPAGRYRLEMLNSDGSSLMLIGRFSELDEPTLIRMTWRWRRETETEEGEETVNTIRFSAVGQGALLRLSHEGFAAQEECNLYESGWASRLDRLEGELTNDPCPQARTAVGTAD